MVFVSLSMVDLYELLLFYVFFWYCSFTQEYLQYITKVKVKEIYKYCNWTKVQEKKKYIQK